MVIAPVKFARSALVLEAREDQITHTSQPQFSGVLHFGRGCREGRDLSSVNIREVSSALPLEFEAFIELKSSQA